MSFPLLLILFVFTACFWILIGTYAIAGLNALLTPKWIEPLKPSLLKLSKAIVPMWILFFVVLLFRNSIFPWATEVKPLADFHSFYFTPHFFFIRGILYLIFAGIFSRSIRLGRDVNAALTLVLILFLGSLASFDWVMSVAPHFHSTIFGLLMIVNGSLMVHAYSLTRLGSHETPPLDDGVMQDLNNIHLAMVALWSYLTVMQYLTVWSGNLPEEAIYFKDRFHGWAGGLAAFILIAQTLIPISLLLFKKLKSRLVFTRNLAYWTLFVQTLNLWWTIGGTR
jgi:hypothetical protein